MGLETELRKAHFLANDILWSVNHQPVSEDDFEIDIDGKTYTSAKEGGSALINTYFKYIDKGECVVGSYLGYNIKIDSHTRIGDNAAVDLKLVRNGSYDVPPSIDPMIQIKRLNRCIDRMPKALEELHNNILWLKSLEKNHEPETADFEIE